MKKFIVFLTLASVILTGLSCGKKECKLRPAARDAEQIESFAIANGIDATAHPKGFYYEIIDPGSGATVTAESSIVITYVGKFLSGQEFTRQDTPNNTPANPAWPLTQLIQGWQLGIPLIKEGGTIKLIIPSALAYGCEQYYSIPGNSVLYFEIKLIDVQ